MTRTRSWFLFGALAAAALLARGDVRAQDPAAADADGTDDAADEDPATDAGSEWPREIDATTAKIVVYQPQLDAYADGVIQAHSALAITPKGATEPVFGAVWFKARMEVDRESRVCDILDVEVPRARFPEATPEAEAKLAEIIRQVVPGWAHPISMDRLLPALAALDRARESDAHLLNDAPRILVETSPALLVPIDGDARLADVPGSRIRRVVNTPVALLFEPVSKTYWVDGGAAWLYASGVDGPYKAAEAPPPEIAAVKTSNEVRLSPAPAASGKAAPPKVVVAHEPTELLVFAGEPQWKALVADELSYATNTSSAVFATRSDGRFYVLLSGRWFRATSLTAGPWEFVASDALPACFGDIPEDSEMGGVLAHVAGTELANEAVLDAQIPQTKAIRRDAAKCTVVYDGEPKFVPVPGTDIRYAVNTQSQVLMYRDRFYCCDQGAWFVSNAPTGPWALADDVPRSFQQIPPECPCYNVKYVYVYDATPEVVYVGYTPGYLGWYPWCGAVVWGTGWRYPCWYGDHWYPRCATWGVSVGYNAWSGGWYAGLSYVWPGGWSLGIGYYAGWGWGGAWWGPCGYRPWHRHDGEDHHPVAWGRGFDHGTPGGARWHDGTIYDSPRNRGRNAPGRTVSRPQSRRPGFAPTPAAPRPTRPRNDVYSDRDGGVWRRGNDGAWHQRDGRTWRPVPPERLSPPRSPAPQRPRVQHPPVRPAPTPQLGRDAWARDRGSARARGGGGGGSGGGGRHR
jgi:hypothetical protein